MFSYSSATVDDAALTCRYGAFWGRLRGRSLAGCGRAFGVAKSDSGLRVVLANCDDWQNVHMKGPRRGITPAMLAW